MLEIMERIRKLREEAEAAEDANNPWKAEQLRQEARKLEASLKPKPKGKKG